MKKITLLAAVAVAVFATSCTKDRVCTCTTTTSGGTKTDVITYSKAHKKNAQLFCEGQATQTTTTMGSVTVTGDKTTCTLK